jgi:hypothetical protein
MNPQRLCDFLKQYPEIVFAYLFGSFVEGLDYHDIDVGVFLQPVPEDIFEYEMALSIALTRKLHKSVDVHVLNHASLGFHHSVLRGELLFAQEEDSLTDFIEHVNGEYMEFSYHIQEYLKAVTT